MASHFAHLEPCKCNRTYDRLLLFFFASVSHAHMYFRQSRVGLRLEDVLVA